MDSFTFNTDYINNESSSPTSTRDSASEISSHSVLSSIELLEKGQEFLNHSWPLPGRAGKELALYDDRQWNCAGNPCTSEGCPVSRGNSLEMADLFRPISQNSGRQSTPRTRQTDRSTSSPGCSPDAAALYGVTSRGRHYNPSGSGHRAGQEIEESTTWANSYLQCCPHGAFIADLTRQLADGQIILHLVEVLLGEHISPIHVKPTLEVQKIENIQSCLNILKTHGVLVDGISPEDIIKENTKVVLALCKCLRKHFGSARGSPTGLSDLADRRSISPAEVIPRPYIASPTQPDYISTNDLSRQSAPYILLDTEDMALLGWVAQLTGQAVNHYDSFQDGHILCLLINKLTGDAVPDVVLDYGLPSEKVSLVLQFADEELGVTADLSPEEVVCSTNACKLCAFLKELHGVFLEQVQREQDEDETRKMEELKKRARKLNGEDRETLHLRKMLYNGSTSSRDGSAQQSSSACREEEEQVGAIKPSLFSTHFLPDICDKQEEDFAVVHRINDSFRETVYDNRIQHKYCSKTLRDSHHFDRENEISDYRRFPTQKSDSYFEEMENAHDAGSPLETMSRANNTAGLRNEPLTTRSWQKEREGAKLKLDELNHQLQLLKEEYFNCMNIEIKELHEEDTNTPVDQNQAEVFDTTNHTDNVKEDDNPEREQTSRTKLGTSLSSRSLSSLYGEGFSSRNKGTTPPYRTWSKYENTADDRYPMNSKKNLKTSHTTNKKEQPSGRWTGPDSTALTHDDDHSIGTYSDSTISGCDTDSLRSSQTKPIQEHPRHMEELRFFEIEPRVDRADRLQNSGRPQYGITALVRLSSKKADAASATDKRK